MTPAPMEWIPGMKRMNPAMVAAAGPGTLDNARYAVTMFIPQPQKNAISAPTPESAQRRSN